ncbi:MULTISPECIES: glycerophosphodiester phosphodiesterase [Brevibacillus]|uniref:glycerophosphodiester phosphodiesterase n=1 Tax=Brevibacillus TaxID=55080 RepID=UPI000469AC50|nr:glycerophosphodiester phosphodiesterase family protein [Brevibacillus borstelensis]KKX56671.1 glycerophosphodiester phosphodiesterase [Brevibacillus borstelensis cifa_chp40]MCC0565326.1 glycerophosphodiester phosphodiesterase [Brevibacillus borstelensis]MCM3470819.1 glycerophosphodiester phosphodiesterase [Brevibacillus borstelensis]MCM3561888.1 glycerophosphodiester phosphodiesterase [Brevibacillus borstelensis]MCM3590659.1 glycerophosphodiester phosphodiesterase [Brevibacillus borstelensi
MTPLIYAHRGASGRYPENTMEAFRAAVRRRADGIELDVQLSKDDKVVVIHDHHLERTTNGRGTVRQHTWEELKKFRADKAVPSRQKHIRIPTLREVLHTFAPTKLRFCIELKNFFFAQPQLEEYVIGLIRQYDLTSRTVISSFNFDSLLAVKELDPNQTTALLYIGPLHNPWEVGSRYRVDELHVPKDQLTSALVSKAKENGFRVVGWTINSTAGIRDAAKMNVDGIITNYPGRARKALHKP